MSPEWLTDVTRFADVLEATQQELLSTLRLKRRALVSGSARDLQQLNDSALETARRLKLLTAWRSRLLDQAQDEGDQARTISDVLARSADPWPEELRARLAAVQQRFGEVQRESWIQWIIAQRTEACYSDILELLARGGQRSPVYEETVGAAMGSGGAVLDAAV